MKNQIKISTNISIDTAKLIQSRMVILANSGAGKSYAIRKFAEEAMRGTQTIIIDPEGEFSSLREKYDFILAGKNADVPAETRSAALLAVRLLELGKSAVIDLYELHPQERQRFVKLFFDAMINTPKELYHPVFIVLDEAHEYAPEGKPSEATYAVEAMASRGRKRGFCLIPASQRISKLSKNVSAECNNKLIGRASQDIDMKRAGDELGFTKDRMVELRQLKPGEFFAFGPAISDEVVKTKIGQVHTSHAKVGYHGTAKVPPPSQVIKKVLAEIKDLPAEAEQEAKTVAELKKENSELKRKMQQNINEGIRNSIVEPSKQAIKKAVEENEKRLTAAFDRERKYHARNFSEIMKVMEKINKLSDSQFFPLKPTFTEMFSPEALEPAEELVFENVVPGSPRLTPESVDQAVKNFGDSHRMTFAKKTDYVNMDGNIVGPLNKGEREILTAIAQHDGITTEHIAILTGYKQTSRRVYLNKLIAKGYIEPLDQDGRYFAKREGLLALGDFEPLPTGDALREHYLETLPEGEKKIFRAFVNAYPRGLNKENLLEITGYKMTSIRVYINKMIARKIIDTVGPGVYQLSEKLYG